MTTGLVGNVAAIGDRIIEDLRPWRSNLVGEVVEGGVVEEAGVLAVDPAGITATAAVRKNGDVVLNGYAEARISATLSLEETSAVEVREINVSCRIRLELEMKQMRYWLLGLLLLFSPLEQQRCGAETWAQRLGYSADAKVVILYAAHMGAAHETNVAGASALSKGQATSASVMVPCPWVEGFADWYRDNQDHDIGVCLTLNSPDGPYRWRPLTSDAIGSTLVDPHGFLWPSPHQAAVRVDRDEVARELVLQIERARTAGIQPTHLITGMGTLFMRPDLLDLYLNLAEKYWVPAVVVELTPDHIERFDGEGFEFSEDMQMLMKRYPLPKLDEIVFLKDTETYEAKQAELAAAIAGLKPGLTQIMFSPATSSKTLKQITPRWQQLVWDAKLLADPKTKQLLKKEGVQLTNWREVMERFEHGAKHNRTAKPGK